MDTNSLRIIKKNIDLARACQTENISLKIIVVVSGSAVDRENWEARFARTRSYLFGKDTVVLSLEEKIGNKNREGNFLGTLLAYKQIKDYALKTGLSYRNFVTLAGMIIGKGERISPFTQIEGNRKPALKVNSGFFTHNKVNSLSLTAIEEALFYFMPVGQYLEKGGFRGILDKWGDETEIASVDLSATAFPGNALADWDLVKFVSVLKLTDELAKQKDWVVFDEAGNMLGQLPRNHKTHLISALKVFNIKPGPDGEYAAGVSMGPAAISYAVLDIAEEVFAAEIIKENVYFDFDPYFFMAICQPDDRKAWDNQVAGDLKLKELMRMVPDFFSKVQSVKTRFYKKYGRPLNIKIFDLGSDVYWADIGQHKAMAEKYRSLLAASPAGEIARYLENINHSRDEKNNIIINSKVSALVSVHNSVIINSTLTGSGCVEGSVVKESVLHNPELCGAFAVLSHRLGKRLFLDQDSGIYNSLGGSDLVLEKGMRSGTLLTGNGSVELKVAESTDLRNREKNYNLPVCGNPCSFQEAYNAMEGAGMADLEERRQQVIKALEVSEETD